jgi:hypothetical protein
MSYRTIYLMCTFGVGRARVSALQSIRPSRARLDALLHRHWNSCSKTAGEWTTHHLDRILVSYRPYPLSMGRSFVVVCKRIA